MNAEHLLNHTIGHYRLLDVLGKGGMSIVFLAQNLENPQDTAAIKILIPSSSTTGDEFTSFQARFRREALAVHQLHHEHILPVLDYGEEEDGLFYMIMPLIAGGTLTQLLSSTPEPLPLDEIARYLNQLASAVDYSNQHGMVHRDIKPSNVLVDEEKNIYLADFGIVRLFDSSHLALDEAPPTLTATGKIYGTPAYMAPERFKGEPAEPATDLYALGVLLYQLVTGQVPFEAENALALGMKHLTEEPLRPRALRPELPEPSEVAILKALAKQPAERFASASALAIAFETGLQGVWVTELLPLSSLNTQAEQLIASPTAQPGHHSTFEVSERNIPLVAPAVFEETTQFTDLSGHEPMIEAPGSVLPIATAGNVSASARRTYPSGGNFRAFSLGMLVMVLLVFSGVFAFVVTSARTSTGSQPGIHVSPTSASNPSTKTPISPALGVPSSGRNNSTSTPGGSSTPTPGNTPSPTPSPTIPPTPVPTTPPTPVPTTPPTPAPTIAPTVLTAKTGATP